MDTQQQPLINLPAEILLERFGAGSATPGSGCAAALMALLSASLICAVAKLTVEKGKKGESRERARVMISLLEGRIMPRLKELFQLDADVFDKVIDARKRREDPTLSSDKRRNTAEASDQLKQATDILFEIVELSFQIIANGVSIWELGYTGAMGDAGAGISAGLAAVTTCLLVANLNLRTARSTWAKDAKSRWEDVQQRMEAAQDQVFRLVRQSNEQTAKTLALPLQPLETPPADQRGS